MSTNMQMSLYFSVVLVACMAVTATESVTSESHRGSVVRKYGKANHVASVRDYYEFRDHDAFLEFCQQIPEFGAVSLIDMDDIEDLHGCVDGFYDNLDYLSLFNTSISSLDGYTPESTQPFYDSVLIVENNYNLVNVSFPYPMPPFLYHFSRNPKLLLISFQSLNSVQYTPNNDPIKPEIVAKNNPFLQDIVCENCTDVSFMIDDNPDLKSVSSMNMTTDFMVVKNCGSLTSLGSSDNYISVDHLHIEFNFNLQAINYFAIYAESSIIIKDNPSLSVFTPVNCVKVGFDSQTNKSFTFSGNSDFKAFDYVFPPYPRIDPPEYYNFAQCAERFTMADANAVVDISSNSMLLDISAFGAGIEKLEDTSILFSVVNNLSLRDCLTTICELDETLSGFNGIEFRRNIVVATKNGPRCTLAMCPRIVAVKDGREHLFP
mmetsp:Transcript_21332/g.60060  ORF Transcript_21332/g.60060 Transcript_21332/m.60060 type:complete len:433 (+) Transcript_21332:103-1401(+)